MRRAAVIAVAPRDGGVRGRRRRGGDRPPRLDDRRERRSRRARPPARAAADRLAPLPERAGLHLLDAARPARPLAAARPARCGLPVAVADNADAPRGVLVFLTGGPGQPGVAVRAARAPAAAPRSRADYRLVMIDQRGTGAGALRCPALQRAMGSLRPHGADAVGGDGLRAAAGRRPAASSRPPTPWPTSMPCARRSASPKLDARRRLVRHLRRRALRDRPPRPREPRSCSTRSCRHAGLDGLEVDGMRATARVLRAVCRDQHCPGDPAADLAAVVRRRHDGPELYDTIVALSVGAPDLPRASGARCARRAPGDRAPLRRARRASCAARRRAPRRFAQPGPARRDPVRRHAVRRGGAPARRWRAARRRVRARGAATTRARSTARR